MMGIKTSSYIFLLGAISALPAISHAESSWYGSIRAGIEYTDDGTTDETTFKSFASRMGFKGETEVRPGLEAFGEYQFGVDLDSSDDSSDALSTRLAYLGLKGEFGRVWIGQGYHTFYNAAIVPTDIGWWDVCHGTCNNATYAGRTGEALTYEKNMGSLGVSATAYLSDDDYGDAIALGATYKVNDALKLGFAYRNEQDSTLSSTSDDTLTDEDVYGLSAQGDINKFNYGVTFTDRDSNSKNSTTAGSAFDVHLGYGAAYLVFGGADLDNGRNPSGYTLGYTHSIGKDTSAWFEARTSDADDGGDDATALRAVLKYDF